MPTDMVQDDPLIEVSSYHLGLAATPMLGMALISWYFNLGLEGPMFVGVVRTFVQLSILSIVLRPLFSWGVESCLVVLAYVLFMLLLAAFESTSRSVYYFDGMFWFVLCIIFQNVAFVSIFAFATILQPTPIWDPQYVIPIVGMLLGNCINGISLSMNTMLTSVVESSREIELLLSFGATSYEASFRLLTGALKASTIPQLNGMAVIGIISIPGMMTGQILGGSSVVDAARYQILIVYLIAACCFGSIYILLYSLLPICFDSQMILRTDRLKKSEVKQSILEKMKDVLGSLDAACSGNARRVLSHHRISSAGLSVEESKSLFPNDELSIMITTQGNGLSTQDSLKVSNLNFSFEMTAGEEANDILSPELPSRRTLFHDLSFKLSPGGSAMVQGPSGVGKSTLLRILAGLAVPNDGFIELSGKRQTSYQNMASWRRQILYVPQNKVEIPGTPLEFVKKIASFHVRKHDVSVSQAEMESTIMELLTDWGLNKTLLHSEWKTLSGGESQKVLLAIALASRPKVLLLDESTSSIDPISKIQMEKSVLALASKTGMCTIWITHDEMQSERMCR